MIRFRLWGQVSRSELFRQRSHWQKIMKCNIEQVQTCIKHYINYKHIYKHYKHVSKEHLQMQKGPRCWDAFLFFFPALLSAFCLQAKTHSKPQPKLTASQVAIAIYLCWLHVEDISLVREQLLWYFSERNRYSSILFACRNIWTLQGCTSHLYRKPSSTSMQFTALQKVLMLVQQSWLLYGFSGFRGIIPEPLRQMLIGKKPGLRAFFEMLLWFLLENLRWRKKRLNLWLLHQMPSAQCGVLCMIWRSQTCRTESHLIWRLNHLSVKCKSDLSVHRVLYSSHRCCSTLNLCALLHEVRTTELSALHFPRLFPRQVGPALSKLTWIA